jgi:hypothetical protein
MSESIDFNKPLKDACSSEIAEHCADVPSGHARVIRCLQDASGDGNTFGSRCTEVRLTAYCTRLGAFVIDVLLPSAESASFDSRS